jgi:hypothetical protein
MLHIPQMGRRKQKKQKLIDHTTYIRYTNVRNYANVTSTTTRKHKKNAEIQNEIKSKRTKQKMTNLIVNKTSRSRSAHIQVMARCLILFRYRKSGTFQPKTKDKQQLIGHGDVFDK